MKARYRLLLALIVVTSASFASADKTYLCQHKQVQRIIRVIYANQETLLPCEVQYQKADSVETLWQAQNLAGYCDEKALAFVEKQRGWGWQCDEVIEQPVSEPAEDAAEENERQPEVEESTAEAPAREVVDSYQRHALFMNALSTVAPFKARVEEYYQINNRFPSGLSDIGFTPEEMKNSSYINDLSVVAGGKIYIQGTAQLGLDTIILFEPKATLGGTRIEWRCSTSYTSTQKMRSCGHDASLVFPIVTPSSE